MVQNPLIWACVGRDRAESGLGGRSRSRSHVFVDALGRSSLALGLLIVGAGLRIDELVRPNAVMLVTCALKLVVMPAIAIAHRACGRPRRRRTCWSTVCCTAVPAASNSYILARQMGGDAPLMAQILTFETVLAAITMPIAIGLVS